MLDGVQFWVVQSRMKRPGSEEGHIEVSSKVGDETVKLVTVLDKLF